MSLFMIGLFAANLATAQDRPPRPSGGIRTTPRQAPAPEQGPEGEAKLRWVCKQLKLDEQQKQQAEALMAVYHAALEEQGENALQLMEQIRDKLAEVQAARDEGNTELASKLQAELREMAPGVKAENTFFESLAQILTEEQVAKLPSLRERAAKLGDISMRPVHVVRAAHELGLTLEQQRQIEQLLIDYRAKLISERPANKIETKGRVEELVDQVREVLTPDQATRFDEKIASLRDGAEPAKRVKLPPDNSTPYPRDRPAHHQRNAPGPACPVGSPCRALPWGAGSLSREGGV
jgi:hypothetical protein